ncbi:unnamed protein product, partial [Coccothraustes coccothraustes]
ASEHGAQCAGLAAVPLPAAARRGGAGSSPGSRGPEPGAHGAPAQRGCRAEQHRGSPGSSRPSAPCPREPGASGCWPRLRAVRAGEAGAGRRQRPAEGLSPRQPFPAAALSSWQRPSTCAGPCAARRAHRRGG